MTTQDPNVKGPPEDSVEEEPVRENPLFLISVDRLAKLERSPVHMVAGRLATSSPSKSKAIGELGDVKSLIREISQNYKNDESFIRSDMPVQEIVFRTLLARNNRPMSLADLHYELTEKFLKRYLPPDLVEKVVNGEMNIEQKPEAITGTILFSDLVGFTNLSGELRANKISRLLNEYLTEMVRIIYAHEGTIEKFIGDAIMAGFGIPVANDDDEDRGVRAGINMISRLWDWNEQREKEGKMPVDMGLGLNTDKVVSGNIGSSKRMDYTMIGDGVNLAARLESACKQYSARILISDYTYHKLKGTYQVRYIDDVVVKGKTEPVGVREVLDYHNSSTFPNLMDTVNHFNEGRELYKNANWDKAIKSFKECLKANKEDKLSNTYIERCEIMKKQNPKEWNGVWAVSYTHLRAHET